MSVFIEIKGKCGAGKTTVMKIMAKALEANGINVDCHEERFPYDKRRKVESNKHDDRVVHIDVLQS
jgi:thymidylate kinase